MICERCNRRIEPGQITTTGHQVCSAACNRALDKADPLGAEYRSPDGAGLGICLVALVAMFTWVLAISLAAWWLW